MLAVFAAGLTWIIGPRAASASDFHTELRLSLERIIGDRDGARQLGALYLTRHPATVDDLLRESGGFPAAAFGAHGRKALARALIDRRTADFAAGRTVVLDGWVVARSEAQVCALLCLL